MLKLIALLCVGSTLMGCETSKVSLKVSEAKPVNLCPAGISDPRCNIAVAQVRGDASGGGLQQQLLIMSLDERGIPRLQVQGNYGPALVDHLVPLATAAITGTTHVLAAREYGKGSSRGGPAIVNINENQGGNAAAVTDTTVDIQTDVMPGSLPPVGLCTSNCGQHGD